MPLYDFQCPECGCSFELLIKLSDPAPKCPQCGVRAEKLISAPAVRISGDQATARIEKRVKSYLRDGKFAEATRFADKAASMVKSDKVKRIADKLHQKTGLS